MTVTVGANPTLTITVGNNRGEVSTLAELSATLGGLIGGTASVDTSNGNVTAGNLTDAITIGGDVT